MENIYQKVVAEALESVKDVPDADLKKAGFEVVLRQLLQATPGGQLKNENNPGGEGVVVTGNTQVSKTGLTTEEINILFEDKNGTLCLKVKPTGQTIAEQHQKLAHAILVGHLALLGKESISSLVMLAAARDWHLPEKHFARNIQSPGYIQAKGVGKGVIYSLKPGAVWKLKESLQKMAHGEE